MAPVPPDSEPPSTPPPSTPLPGHTRSRGELLLVGLVACHVLVALLLAFGPATDTVAELEDFDVDRFQRIADASGSPYVDHEVEYPPGGYAIIRIVAGEDLVATNQRLVLLMLAADLALAAVLGWAWRRRAATAYLALSLLALPGLFLRFDVVAALLAVLGVALLRRRQAAAGVSLAAAVLVKTWPVVVLPLLLRRSRRTAAIMCAAVGALVGAGWIVVSGLDGIGQVVGFRGAEGYHVESTPGLLVGLLGDRATRFDGGAYRVGENQPLVSGLLLLTLLVCLVVLWRRTLSGPSDDREEALACTAAVCLLLVLAPLLSPQFLVWAMPWAAVAWSCGARRPALLLAAAAAITTVTLTAYEPEGVGVTSAQLILLARNGLLAATAIVAWRAIAPIRAADVVTPDGDGDG
jgi:hypothetical protein